MWGITHRRFPPPVCSQCSMGALGWRFGMPRIRLLQESCVGIQKSAQGLKQLEFWFRHVSTSFPMFFGTCGGDYEMFYIILNPSNFFPSSFLGREHHPSDENPLGAGAGGRLHRSYEGRALMGPVTHTTGHWESKLSRR